MPEQDSPDTGVDSGAGATPTGAGGTADEDGTAAAPTRPAAVRSYDGYEADPADPAGRSPRVRLAAAAVAIMLVSGVVLHLLFVTMHVAPPNRASQKYQKTTNEWIYPLFEQSWKLFAPDPLNLNIHVTARVRVKAPDGTVTESAWMDLTGDDIDHIKHNPYPSKADQNLLRRAWDFYTGSHNSDGSRANDQGELAEQYLRRIVIKRLQADGRADGVVAVQVRSVSTPIAPPGQSQEEPMVRDLGWLEAQPDDFR
ncbi:DUF5819 family protein [Yinghuangia seranimata]|uniref:DUF5819 family protein n=1 Tax=Yinghuangia seranimata TaxID=408067 RepID=UPI00248B1778|nr:DUF5819 family protein [Yinghuangia seranimata]MDI2131933.1 DUF5819 family protein [Yinghuangia seranimata]